MFHNGLSLLQGLSNLFVTKTLTKILWLISYIRLTALHIEIVSIYVQYIDTIVGYTYTSW